MVFDEFSGFEKSVEKFKRSPSSFSDSSKENSFFEAVIYGLLFKLSDEKVWAEIKWRVFWEGISTKTFVTFVKLKIS